MERKFMNNKMILSHLEGKTLKLKVNGNIVKMKLKDVKSISEEEAEEIIHFLIASLEDNKLLSYITTSTKYIIKSVKIVEEKIKKVSIKCLFTFKDLFRNFIIRLKKCGILGISFLKNTQKFFILRLHSYENKYIHFYHKQTHCFYTLYRVQSQRMKSGFSNFKTEIYLFIKNQKNCIDIHLYLECINTKFRNILNFIKERLSKENKLHFHNLKLNYKKKQILMLKTSKILLCTSIVFSMCMFNNTKSFAAEEKLTKLITGKNTSSDTFIGGNYIELGISNIGSFGSLGSAPSQFHNNNSSLMPKTNYEMGMIANENGWFNGIRSKTVDFFMPGIIDEAWVVGINGTTSAIASAACSSSSYPSKQNLDNNFKTSILYDDDNVTPIGARTTGTLYGGKVQLTQDIILGVNDKLYTTNVTLRNISGGPLTNMRYMRAFDPDQNSGMGTSGMYTHNYVQNVEGKSAKVTAYGKVNQAPFIFYAADSRAKAGYAKNGIDDVFYFTDIYNRNNYMKTANTSGLDGKTNYIDGDIFIYFDLGTLQKEQETKLTYYSSLDADVQISSDKIDAKAVEDFIEETVPDPEEINSNTIVTEKPKVDEAKDKYDDLSDSAKEKVPTDTKDKLDAASDKVDTIIKEDYIESIVSGLKDVPDSKEDFTTYEDLEKLEEIKNKKEEYDKLVGKDSKDTWLSPDKFDKDDSLTYDEVKDAFSKLDNLEKDIPSVSEVKTYDITFNITGEQTKKEIIKIIAGKSYTYSVKLSSNERIKEVSENATIQGNNEIVITNVQVAQSVNIVTENIVKEQLLSNLAKLLDSINVSSGTIAGTELSLLVSALDNGVDIVFPTITNDLFTLENINIKVKKVHNSKDPLRQTLTITLSKNGESISKNISVVFEGDTIKPVVEKLTSDAELNQPATTKTLKFKVSDIGTGINADSIKIESYLNPGKIYNCTSLGNGQYSFIVDESDGYEIHVKDYAENEAMETYIVKSIDKTVPIIQGVENSKNYYLQHTIIIKDQNLKEVTVNGTKYTDFSIDGQFKTKKIIVKDIGSYHVQATDGANPIDISFNIIELPVDLDARNEAIKTMRDELAGQQTVLTTEEYKALDQHITDTEANINEAVIIRFEDEFASLNKKYASITQYTQRTEFDDLLKEVNNGSNYYGKLTDSIQLRRESLIAQIGAKLQPIRDEQAKIDNIVKQLLNYKEDTISSNDKGIIENYQAQLNVINTNLIENGSNQSTLVNAKTKLSSLLTAINNLTKDIHKLDESINSLTNDIVKSSDKIGIEKVIADLKSYKITKGDRLSTEEINLINTKLNNADGLLTRIKDVMKIVSDNKAIIEAMTVEKVTKESYENVVVARAKISAISNNLTTEETQGIVSLDAHIAELKLKVDLDAIKDIDITIKDLTVDNVTEDNRVTIEAVIKAIEDIESSATSEQQTVLAIKKKNANQLIDKLNEVKTAIQASMSQLDNIDLTNVKSQDKNKVETTIIEIDTLLESYENNLTTAQITELNNIKIFANSLLDKIEEVAKIIDEIKVASELDKITLTTSQSGTITKALGSINNIESNLTDAEKTTINGYKTLLEELQNIIQDIQEYLNELQELSSKTIKDISSDILGRIDVVLEKDYTQNLTTEQVTLVEQQIQKITELKKLIGDVQKAITDIEAVLSGLTLDNVKTSDKDKVTQVNQMIKDFAYDISILTEDQKKQLNNVTELTKDLAKRIQLIEEELSVIHNALKDLTTSTVKLSHKDSILTTKQKIQTLLGTYHTNLLQSEIDVLNDEISIHIPDLEAKIKKAEDDLKAFEDALAGLGLKSMSKTRSAGLTIDNVTADNKAEIDDTITKAQAVIDNETVDENIKDKARETLIQLELFKARIKDVKKEITIIENGLKDLSKESINGDHQCHINEIKKSIEVIETKYLGNVTNEQEIIITESQTKLKEFEAILKNVQDEMKKIKEDLDKFTLESIKDTQRDELSALKETIDKVKENLSNHLSKSDKKQFDSYHEVLVKLNQKIDSLESALQDIQDVNKDLTIDKVVVSDKDRVNASIDKIKDIYNQYENNLTDKNKEILENKKQLNEELLNRIEVIVELNKKLLEAHTLDMNEEKSKDYIESLLDIYNKLSDTQKSCLDSKQISYYQDVLSQGVTNSIKKDNVHILGVGNTHFINGTEVETKDVLDKLEPKTQQNINSNLKSNFHDFELIALYDVKLIYKGQYIQPNGKLKIILQLPDNFDQYEDIRAVYVDNEGNVVEYPYEIKDNCIYIETDHFSYYGILAKKKVPQINGNPSQEETSTQNPSKTSDMSSLELYSITTLFSIAAWFAIKRKKETI